MNSEKIQELIGDSVQINVDNSIEVIDADHFIETKLDHVVYEMAVGEIANQDRLAKVIRAVAAKKNVYPASIAPLYNAFAANEIPAFTVPAINVRTLNYEMSAAIFTTMINHNIGFVLFEIAVSEMKYTNQTHNEFVSCVLAGALKAGYTGPVFIQGDHYQFKTEKFVEDAEMELAKMKETTKTAIECGFYNIDIDASTLVNLSLTELDKQQQNNYEMTYALSKYIREIQPNEVEVSVGGEIGHIGGKNSNVEEFEAFITGYNKLRQDQFPGLSKVSVQTGTSHGGVINSDGSIADVEVDFSVLSSITESAKKFGIGGTVQHGASTLPDELFYMFPENNAIEIHLATGFQNIIYDCLPQEMVSKIYAWLDTNAVDEMKEGMSQEQFHYKTRKKAFGAFKKELWDLDLTYKTSIIRALSDKFETIFSQLEIYNTKEVQTKLFNS